MTGIQWSEGVLEVTNRACEAGARMIMNVSKRVVQHVSIKFENQSDSNLDRVLVDAGFEFSNGWYVWLKERNDDRRISSDRRGRVFIPA